jgi:uncharacterized protein YjiS (DUF1127 family)
MATNAFTPDRADLLAGRVQSAPTRRLAGLLARLNDWLTQRRRYRTTVRELEALDDGLLSDIGIPRGQIELIARQVAAHGRWR